MEQIPRFLKPKQASAPLPAVEPKGTEDPIDLKRAELTKLALELEGEGFNLDTLAREFDKQVVIGTTNSRVFRYMQLYSELTAHIPFATVDLNENFSGRVAVQLILDQITGHAVPLSSNYYADLDDRINEEPYTLAVSIPPGLQPNSEKSRFADMFRYGTSAKKIRGLVLYSNTADVPQEIRRNIGHIARSSHQE